MRARLVGTMVLAVTLLAPLLISAQGPSPTTGYRAPRSKDGKPNINGIWQALNEANWDLEGHGAAPGPYWQLGAEFAVPPSLGVVEGGAIPYKPEALQKKRANFADRMHLDPEVKCYLPGVPRAMYMPYPFQIIQSTEYTMMAFEYAGALRTIYMNKQQAPADSWMGWSNGRWEGETLVIETTDFNDQAWFDRAGNFHSEALRVVERLTPASPDHLSYEATIEDPNVFTRPWKISMPLYRRVDRNAQLLEFKCVEFAEDVIYGALRKVPLK
jgi:hypothetical protein